MQLFASDKNNAVISAGQALRREDYFCLECKKAVRLRGGTHKQLHFYHRTLSRACRQSGKSLLHLSIQLYLQRLLSKELCRIEHPFPQIGRIADVAWPEEKLIFEIQCSPISITEVENRNRDYGSLGYQVVWILHDKRFNKRRLSPAENSSNPHYYTNIDYQGKGMIYDQYAHDENFLRKRKLPPLSINIASPIRPLITKQFPHHILKKREKEWQIAFAGDIYDRWESPSLQKSIATFDALYQKSANLPKRSFLQKLFRPYRLLFQLLLEKNCD